MTRRGAVALCALLGACAVHRVDPFDRGLIAARRGDLLEALRAFESVPATHPRRAEAVVAANDVQNRVRRSHQALLDGIVLRSEGRDREAIASMQRARDAWPGLPSVDAWIGATRDRWSATNVRIVALPGSRPAVDCEAEVAGAEVPAAATVVASSPNAVVTPENATPRSVGDEAADSLGRAADDPVTLGLVAVEARLGHGELELAVIDLMELARRFPTEPRVQNRLARVLHQRALLRYGQGALTTAIADWERVLSLQPDNRLVKALLDAVRAEAAAPL